MSANKCRRCTNGEIFTSESGQVLHLCMAEPYEDDGGENGVLTWLDLDAYGFDSYLCANFRGDMTTITAQPAIYFCCAYCDHPQYELHNLQHGWYKGRAVNQAEIPCEKCARENHIIEELEEGL